VELHDKSQSVKLFLRQPLVPGHLRCHPDEIIKKMATSGGVMGITLLRMLVRSEDPTTIEHVLDHYDHVIKITAAEHVGIGTDSGIIPREKATVPEEQKRNLAQFDPAYRMRDSVWIEGINYPKKVFDLVEGFVRRRYSEQMIAGILGGNFRRALGAVWQA
jgi:membrane dipeptidase